MASELKALLLEKLTSPQQTSLLHGRFLPLRQGLPEFTLYLRDIWLDDKNA